MLKRIASVYLFVADIRQSRDWYERVLGIAPVEDLPEFARFEVGEAHLCLHRAGGKSPLSTGGEVAYWEVAEFDAAVRRFVDHGGEIYRGPIPTIEDLWICQIRD